MNFIITNDCNKGCPYCFAAENRKHLTKDDGDMTLEQFEKYVDIVPNSNDFSIKLLGGEPTQHKNFNNFLEHLIKRNRSVTIISNFLFNDDTLKYIKNAVSRYSNIHFLINSTNLDVGKNRMEIFSKNYNEIYNELYKYNNEESMSCGITLEHDKDIKYYLNYLNYLNENLVNIERLRISIPFPGGDEDKDIKNVINNKKIDEKILSVIYKTIEIQAKPSIDCILLPCFFNNKEELKFIKRYVDKVRFKCGDDAPTDIFSDNTVSYCYPLRDTVKINMNSYNNFVEAREALTYQYKIIENQVEKTKECLECSFYISKECRGPCLGFYKIKNYFGG